MKSLRIITTVVIGLFIANYPVESQINPLKKIKQKTNEKINQGIDKAFDNAFDKDKKENNQPATTTQPQQTENNTNNQQTTTPQQQNSDNANVKTNAPTLKWAKYDFVPGNKIIFEDNMLHEENGEFPSRWDLDRGTVENAEFGGENVIMFRGGGPTIIPYIKNPEKDYLPEVFTIEFDLYLPSESFSVFFYDRKNQRTPSGADYLSIWGNYMSLGQARSNIPDNSNINKTWAHIAIAFTNGKMKAYINETRLINIPHLEFNPTGISLHFYHANDNRRLYIKNFRIAEGGVKYYDRFLQDGKIVSNGIRFDIGKATLLPESMGVINEIYDLLSQHEEIKFSIEGHTDSDGDFDMNQKLSEERAKTVMDQLVSMGIKSDRLKYKGHGESKPIDNNDTPEGKANNRRVEFIKTN